MMFSIHTLYQQLKNLSNNVYIHIYIYMAHEMFCAPGVRGTPSVRGARGTCFDREGLYRIIDDYNHKYPDKKITYHPNLSTEKLWKLIRDSLADLCGDQEWCWLDQDFLKTDQLVQQYYKPPKPKTQKQWLSTKDIDNVLKQYERQYNDFIYMGTVPRDFDMVIDEYKNMDLCRMYNGEGAIGGGRTIKKYGFVFNLDPHDQRGSHWVSMFMNLSVPDDDTGIVLRGGGGGHIENFIGFFDSYGYPPPKEIKALIMRLKKQAKRCMGIDLVYKCNTVQHQHQDTECGVYSLYFIYQCLRGLTFEKITQSIILDDDVNKFRDFFFRPTIYYQGNRK
jgi:hypothetical protein